MPLPLMLALRFLWAPSQEKMISIMIKICFFSILIGSCALTLVAAIMNGFEKATHSKLQGIHADITISADKPIHYEKLKSVLSAEYGDSIVATSPVHMSQIIVRRTDDLHNEFTICMLKACDPIEEPCVSKLSSMIIESNGNDPWMSLEKDRIFIGSALAHNLNLKVDDAVTLIYPEAGALTSKVSLEERQVIISHIFKTGIQDFDEHVIIGSLALANSLYPAPITQVTLALKNPRDERTIIESLKKRLSLEVSSWKDLYPSLVSALILEKYAMLFILILVTIVASLNIISLLFMFIAQKRTEIALLKSMGMADSSIMSIFIMVSLCITFCATFCGIMLAFIITFFLNSFPFIRLPDVYYATHLPATLDIRIMCSIFILTLIISIIAALIPSYKIKSLMPAHIFKSVA